MGEALLEVVLENLISLLRNEFSTIYRIKSKAQNLSNTLELINAVLEDAEQKQVKDRSIKVWLQQLKDAVYVLDDMLDECSIQSNRLKGAPSLKPKNIMFRYNIGKKFKEITKRFDQIAESKNKFVLRVGVNVREWPIEVAEWRQTSSTIDGPKVYGREDDKEKIVEFLLTQVRDSDFLSVYPIVGLGGVGKTTLAQLVYNDHRVSSNFHTKVWVCVSEIFSVKRILCSIIESITREKCDALDLDVFERKVQELLQGKRYLLVLDDVWNRNEGLECGLSQDKWHKLKSVLSCGSKGSSILVSTRDKDVAEITGTCQFHHLSGLSDNECWLLFKQYAFGHDEGEKEELEAIGKEIVKKCGGLPLAARALGGLMRSRSGEKEWLEVKENRLWSLPDQNYILPALSLSYFYLTPTLKQCFAFCAMFPKDTEIVKEDLIHLWMSNGFISSRKNLDVEDVGNMIWNELCQKSFFQHIKMNDSSVYICFKMHDLIHDLAQSVMGSECLFLENGDVTGLSKSTHHISFKPAGMLSFDGGAFRKVESLRTWYQLKSYNPKFFTYFPTNHSLRVLCTSSFKLSSCASLIHLRYLELYDFDGIETIPDSIYNLQKLEILKLKCFLKLSCLPKHLTRLKNLRHLIIQQCISLSHVSPFIGKLSCLRTLSVYIVGLETGHNLAELHDLKLGGKLSIEGLKNVGSLSDAQDANLMGKKDLQVLCLSWGNSGETKAPIINPKQVLEVLQPHSNVKSLKIRFYDGLCFPTWFGILSSLVSLVFNCCTNCIRLPPIGNLPFLKNLELFNMENLQYMGDDESLNGVVRPFPSLEKLSLNRLPNLERLLKVDRSVMFPRLSNLTINYCPKLVLPCLSSAKYLSMFGCNNEIMVPISSFSGLTTLQLDTNEDMTSFPEGILRNMACLRTLKIIGFTELKELPNDLFNPALEHLQISYCGKLESLPEKIWEGLRSLRTLKIDLCVRLRSLPESIQHLISLEVLHIRGCPILKERCKEEIGENWDKVAHIPNLIID
ncbi:putative disease resistance protein RGA1 [Trifolium repens]|nr:putative disease resistance protein RGA1 [Trifolium repens]